jgi:hypothetical protein
MKEELTIKHLCAYLPHGVMIVCFDNAPVKMFGISHNTIHMEGGILNYKEAHIGKCKPILRPLSQLTEYIEHDGERFVPIERLLAEQGCAAEYDFIRAIEDDWASADDKMQFAPTTITKKLHAWHFDTFSLIEAGLAEPIPSIPQP